MLVFCDWLSMYQVHAKPVLIVNEGRVFSVDRHGEIQWEVNSKVVHKGSFDTSVRVSSDGHRVVIEGNIGRFGRSDNLFGYSVSDCVALANKLLALFDLPPFTDAAPMPLNGKGGGAEVGTKEYFRADVDKGYQAVASVITRVDLTCNWSTGSQENASQFLRYLAGFKSGKQEPKSYETSGVSWGEGSKYWYAKVYDKAADYIRHLSAANKLHDLKLYEFMKMAGVVRHEITLKSRYLKQNNLWRSSQWENNMQARIYAMFSDVVEGKAFVDSFLEIPGRAGELAVAWRDGADLKKRLSQPTFYRYRRELLKYNIDISVRSDVARLKIKVNVIDLSPLTVPAWYFLPSVDVIVFDPLEHPRASAQEAFLRIA